MVMLLRSMSSRFDIVFMETFKDSGEQCTSVAVGLGDCVFETLGNGMVKRKNRPAARWLRKLYLLIKERSKVSLSSKSCLLLKTSFTHSECMITMNRRIVKEAIDVTRLDWVFTHLSTDLLIVARRLQFVRRTLPLWLEVCVGASCRERTEPSPKAFVRIRGMGFVSDQPSKRILVNPAFMSVGRWGGSQCEAYKQGISIWSNVWWGRVPQPSVVAVVWSTLEFLDRR